MTFVDTNYFIRFLIQDQDNENQYTQTKELFQKAAEGKVELATSTIVLFEIYWVFKSFYQKPRTELIEILQKVLSMHFITIPERDTFQACLEIFSRTTIDDLEDCYNLSFAKENKVKEFKTFDVQLLKQFEKNK